MSRRRYIIITLTMAAMMAVLLKLGFWQVDRLHWKTALLVDLAARAQQDPWQNPLTIAAFQDPENEFVRGYVTGDYEGRGSYAIGPRQQDGMLGYWIVTQLRLENGVNVLINRGFVVEAVKDKLLRGKPPAGQVRVAGIVRRPEDKGPANNPRINVWHRIDTRLMAPGVPGALPLVLYAQESRPADDSELTPVPAAQNIRNEHKNYAIFWFSMAGVLLLVWVLFSLQSRRSASSPDPSGLVS